MRELEYTFQKGFQLGLRPSKGNPTNNEFLMNCFNAKPSALGLLPYEPYQNPLQLAMSWPFPQIFIGISRTILCTQTEVYSVDGSWGTTLKITTTAGNFWDMADF